MSVELPTGSVQLAHLFDGLPRVMFSVKDLEGRYLFVNEAFAQRVPVVSTALGAEGLGAVDGVHLLVADSADSLADACARQTPRCRLRACERRRAEH